MKRWEWILKIVALLTFLVLDFYFVNNLYTQNKPPYAPDEPLPFPKQFKIPNTTVSQSITFTPDGTSFYFVTQDDNGPVVIKYSTFKDGHWSNPKIASFCGQTSVETPFFSPDGNKIFFTRSGGGNRDIWVAEKKDTGWNIPVSIGSPINSTGGNMAPSVAANGNLYFNSNRSGKFQIYYSKWENNKYSNPVRLDNKINDFDVQAFFIEPDESYILFGTYISDSNPADIYISFRNNNSWTTPRSIGARVNSGEVEHRPYVSPDGNYLFFTRNGINQVDWIPILDSLKKVSFPTSIEKTQISVPGKLLLNQSYPDTYNPETVISDLLPVTNFVELKVLDIPGHKLPKKFSNGVI